MKRLLFACLFLGTLHVIAQEGFPKNGVPDMRIGYYAFVNATLFSDYQTRLENATLVIKDGKVEALGTDLAVPTGAIEVDLAGKFLYPALIDPYTNFGLPEPKKTSSGGQPQYFTKEKGPYGWNENIRSTFSATEEFAMDAKAAAELRKIGFGAVNTFQADGLMRGSSLFTNLSDLPVQEAVITEAAAAHFSFTNGTSNQEYPSSIMGRVALLRQTYYDSRWYSSNANKSQVNLSLMSFNDLQKLPQIFEATGGKLRVLLADKIGDEFGVQYIIKGNGDEYQRLEDIKATNASLIIPLNFPDPYDVDDPLDALDVSLAEMKHWEMAPANPKLLADAGIRFAFTLDGLKDNGSYWKSVRQAVAYGLSESQALKAMTFTPAEYFGLAAQVGSLKPGMHANFFIASTNVFLDEAKIQETWVQGLRQKFEDLVPVVFDGLYDLKVSETTYQLELSADEGKTSAKILLDDSTSLTVQVKIQDNRVAMVFAESDSIPDIRLTGWITGNDFKGSGQLVNGSWVEWTATRSADREQKEEDMADKEEAAENPTWGEIIYPFVAYGWTTPPKAETILFKNATVWTLEGSGKLEETDVLVKDGKIAAVGQGMAENGARVVDAAGKHLSPGIIDEHSHIALSSVNEGSHVITAEVRMYDAVDSDDIDLYRQLAGGVTSAQLLHGSANPVGGQSALIKFRWGASPDGLRIQGADGYIKFALGENVKQSNWGSDYRVRFPQTRMGVEQVYVDGFTRARTYGEAKAKYAGLSKKVKSSTPAPRTDLQLETLLEIINSERFITCHSYVQSEINMLMKVAEQFDFKVNTFTHILEGYKVADKMAEHGAGGSTFSDWWAYKSEVRDAIPYNASLMNLAGVVVAINSDDGEMARRLNQEAAKSVKYGGMSEVEALKMVTLNPAKLLHLNDRMGSIKVGKDADLVLWNNHPLSIYAKPEMTLVDGIVYFSLEKDALLRKQVEDERHRLIQKMREAKNGGASTQKPQKKEKHYFECEDIVLDGSIVNDFENE